MDSFYGLFQWMKAALFLFMFITGRNNSSQFISTINREMQRNTQMNISSEWMFQSIRLIHHLLLDNLNVLYFPFIAMVVHWGLIGARVENTLKRTHLRDDVLFVSCERAESAHSLLTTTTTMTVEVEVVAALNGAAAHASYYRPQGLKAAFHEASLPSDSVEYYCRCFPSFASFSI